MVYGMIRVNRVRKRLKVVGIARGPTRIVPARCAWRLRLSLSRPVHPRVTVPRPWVACLSVPLAPTR